MTTDAELIRSVVALVDLAATPEETLFLVVDARSFDLHSLQRHNADLAHFLHDGSLRIKLLVDAMTIDDHRLFTDITTDQRERRQTCQYY